MKASDSLWFGFLVRALAWFKLQQGHFLKLCAIVQRFWKCGWHICTHTDRHIRTHTHIFKNQAFLNLRILLLLVYFFSVLFYIPSFFYSHHAFMTMTCHNDKDSSSYLTIYTVPFHHLISAHAQCHLIWDGFMCLHPPMGPEIVLFLSGGQLIFYYTIKSIRSTHKQLEIKWAPLKGLCACVCVCLCLCVSELSACRQTTKSGCFSKPNKACSSSHMASMKALSK